MLEGDVVGGGAEVLEYGAKGRRGGWKMGMGPALLRTFAVACSLLLVLGLFGCGLWPGRASGKVAGARLDVPDGSLGGSTAWLPDGWIYFHWTPDLSSSDYELHRVAPGKPAERVKLPPDEQCAKMRYLFPHALPDGRLGLARMCVQDDFAKTLIELMAYDPASGRLETLAPVKRFNPTGVTWRRDLQSGYLSSGSGICDGLAPVTRQGIGRFPGPVTLEGRTWRLEESLYQSGSEDCTPQGRAVAPMLTPDDRRLVFLASPESQGHTDQRRLDDPWSVYVQDLPDGTPKRLVGGFHPRGEAIAPDGKHVAITGRRGEQQGVWLLNVDTGSMRELSDARFSAPAFSPDGREMAVAFTPNVDHNELRLLDVPS